MPDVPDEGRKQSKFSPFGGLLALEWLGCFRGHVAVAGGERGVNGNG
jgi:hypothetical protein